MKERSCLSCPHKEVCIKRSMVVFSLFIQTGRYDEVKDAQKNLDIGADCENWSENRGDVS